MQCVKRACVASLRSLRGYSTRVPGRVVDLRSDTVTKPCASMRKVMATAEVGDDVYKEDPTVNALEELVADMVGKEAALFVPSGTMGNLISIAVHCGRGDEIIMGKNSHLFKYETGSPSGLLGLMCNTIPTQHNGTFMLRDIEDAIRPDDDHMPKTRLVSVENTHNECGGRVLPLSFLADVRVLCDTHNLAFHMDGARLFNAAVALGQPVRDIVQHVDSVGMCVSKGLGAPVGGLLAGSKDLVRQARRVRKGLGGGMRQAGVIAAGALYALKHNVERLAEDHEHASRLAHALAELPGVELDPSTVETNLIWFHVSGDVWAGHSAAVLTQKLAHEGVLISGGCAPGGRDMRMRAVTHLDVSSDDIDYAISAFRRVMLAPHA